MKVYNASPYVILQIPIYSSFDKIKEVWNNFENKNHPGGSSKQQKCDVTTFQKWKDSYTILQDEDRRKIFIACQEKKGDVRQAWTDAIILFNDAKRKKKQMEEEQRQTEHKRRDQIHKQEEKPKRVQDLHNKQQDEIARQQRRIQDHHNNQQDEIAQRKKEDQIISLTTDRIDALTKRAAECEFQLETKIKLLQEKATSFLQERLNIQDNSNLLEKISTAFENKSMFLQEKMSIYDQQYADLQQHASCVEAKAAKLEDKVKILEDKASKYKEKAKLWEARAVISEQKLNDLEKNTALLETKVIDSTTKLKHIEKTTALLEEKAVELHGTLFLFESKAKLFDPIFDQIQQLASRLEAVEKGSDQESTSFQQHNYDKLQQFINTVEQRAIKSEEKINFLEPKFPWFEQKFQNLETSSTWMETKTLEIEKVVSLFNEKCTLFEEKATKLEQDIDALKNPSSIVTDTCFEEVNSREHNSKSPNSDDIIVAATKVHDKPKALEPKLTRKGQKTSEQLRKTDIRMRVKANKKHGKKDHKLIITNLNEFECTCGSAFSRMCAWTRHLKPKKYTCSICPKSYNRKDEFEKHKNTHEI